MNKKKLMGWGGGGGRVTCDECGPSDINQLVGQTLYKITYYGSAGKNKHSTACDNALSD